jgi:hypothetical protein
MPFTEQTVFTGMAATTGMRMSVLKGVEVRKD